MSTSEPVVPRRSGTAARERAPWGTISRADVVEAALRSGRGEGFQKMTIRSLAAELGVSPMSLYRHIDDKDDLLDEVVEELLRRTWRPSVFTNDWRTWIAKAADSLRRLLVREPAALYVYLRHPVVSRTAIKRMDAMQEVLGRAGFDESSARRAYAAIHTYTVGFAALESSRASASSASDDEDDLAGRLAAYVTPEQFAEGLGFLMEGIERLALTGR
jgi:TetR/AcrR family transcriptional regulator, tetracycline repressor protein